MSIYFIVYAAGVVGHIGPIADIDICEAMTKDAYERQEAVMQMDVPLSRMYDFKCEERPKQE